MISTPLQRVSPPTLLRRAPRGSQPTPADDAPVEPARDRVEIDWGMGLLATLSVLGAVGGTYSAPPTPPVSSAFFETVTKVDVDVVDLSRQVTTAETRLLSGVQAMLERQTSTPTYLGGTHDHWRDNSDHCYSIYFRVAIREGLMSDSQAEALMARLPVGDKDAWRAVMFPNGYREVLFTVSGERVVTHIGDITAGHLVSFDGGDHVMMSTGRRTADGRHEVYSFKGGGPETPVWGDSLGWDPQAKIHITTIESELEALLRDNQSLDGVKVVAGASVLGQFPSSYK